MQHRQVRTKFRINTWSGAFWDSSCRVGWLACVLVSWDGLAPLSGCTPPHGLSSLGSVPDPRDPTWDKQLRQWMDGRLVQLLAHRSKVPDSILSFYSSPPHIHQFQIIHISFHPPPFVLLWMCFHGSMQQTGIRVYFCPHAYCCWNRVWILFHPDQNKVVSENRKKSICVNMYDFYQALCVFIVKSKLNMCFFYPKWGNSGSSFYWRFDEDILWNTIDNWL